MQKLQSARIVKHSDLTGVILGKDFSNLLKDDVVYEIIEIMDVLVIRPIGESNLINFGHDVNYKVAKGSHLITKEEFKQLQDGNKNN